MVYELRVQFNLIQDVKDFVNISYKYDLPIMLRSGAYVVDGKSLLGVLSLDLSKPVGVTINTTDRDQVDRFDEEVKRFSV